jgi:hypothetical protein
MVSAGTGANCPVAAGEIVSIYGYKPPATQTASATALPLLTQIAGVTAIPTGITGAPTMDVQEVRGGQPTT